MGLRFAVRRLGLLIPLLGSAALGGGIAAVDYAVAAPSIGYFLTSYLIATLAAATLATGRPAAPLLALRVGGLWFGTVAVWAFGVHRQAMSPADGMAVVGLLASSVAATSATVARLERCRLPPPVPTAIVVVTFLAWFTCPIWEPSLLSGDWVARCHPALALNGRLSSLEIWTEQPVAYQLTTLGQDVAYALPGSIRPAVFANLGVVILAALPLLTARAWSWWRRARPPGTAAVPAR